MFLSAPAFNSFNTQYFGTKPTPSDSMAALIMPRTWLISVMILNSGLSSRGRAFKKFRPPDIAPQKFATFLPHDDCLVTPSLSGPLDNTWYTMYTIIMRTYDIEFYETERGDNFVAEFLDGLTEKTRNKTLAWIAMLKKYGPDLKRPYTDLLDGPIRELRVQFARDEVRLLYFFAGAVIVLTHGFIKKTNKVPLGEIEEAKRIMADWRRRNV